VQPDFKEFGKKVILFLHVTSRAAGEPYPDLLKEKGGRGFPTFKFLDAKGNVIVEPKGRSVAEWEAAAKEAAAKMPPPKPGKYKPKILSLSDALKDAKKDEKVVLLVVTGEEKDTEELTKNLYSDKLKKNHEAFIIAELAFKKDDEMLKKLGVKSGAALLAIDPRKDKTEESVLETFSGKPTHSSLLDFLKKWDKGPEKTKK